MIDIRDLRFGNWICLTKDSTMTRQVVAISGVIGIESRGRITCRTADKKFEELSEADIEGIPLTDYLLKELGFVYDEENHWWGQNKLKKPYVIMFSRPDWKFTIASKKTPDWIYEKLKYLHQLQNLYYAMSGEEIKVIFEP